MHLWLLASIIRFQESSHVDLQKKIHIRSRINRFIQPHPAYTASGGFPIPAFFSAAISVEHAQTLFAQHGHNKKTSNRAASHAASIQAIGRDRTRRSQATHSTIFDTRAACACAGVLRVSPIHAIASACRCSGMRRFRYLSRTGSVPCLVTIKEIIHGNCQEAGCKKSRTCKEGNCGQICSCKKTGS